AAGRGRYGAEPHPPPAVGIERFRIAVRRRVGRYHEARPPADRRRRVRVTGSARVGIVVRSAVDAGMLTNSSAAASTRSGSCTISNGRGRVLILGTPLNRQRGVRNAPSRGTGRGALASR